jgi:hypothetical protein
MRTGRLFLLAVSVVLGLATTASAAVPVPVMVTGRADENHATAGWNRAGTVEYVAFARRDPDTGRSTAFLRKIGRYRSETVRLSSADSDVGGFYFGTHLLYTELHRGSYDLRIYNVVSGRRVIPEGVNTRKHEWLPSRSGRYLLFNRDDRGGPVTRVVLRDLIDRREIVLGQATQEDEWVYAGQVIGNWAVWTKCAETCNVFRHSIDEGTTTDMAKLPDDSQYDASVTADATVYIARHTGGSACDSRVELVRLSDTDPPGGTVLARLIAGRFTTLTYARANPGATTDLFFARGSCESFRHDIFKLRVPG